MTTAEESRQHAQALFEAGEFDECLDVARDQLSAAPDDLELLLLAGRAGVEVDAPDSVDYLRHATELAPNDARVWHHLGEALATEGSTSAADGAFRRAVELDPDDQIALTHLGHTSLAAGRQEEGVDYLARAAESTPHASTASISLVEMYRSFGQYEEALGQAQRIAQAAPDDPLALLDVAELSLAVGRLDEARTAFERLRELDEVPGHEAYPLHGMIVVELRREGWDSARELTAQVLAIDPRGLGTEVARLLGDAEGSDGAPPTPDQVDGALTASLGDYRQMLVDDRRLGEVLG